MNESISVNVGFILFWFYCWCASPPKPLGGEASYERIPIWICYHQPNYLIRSLQVCQSF
jgi:hypothetical protein